MRSCSRCGETNPNSEFAWHRKGKGQYDSYCRLVGPRTSRSTTKPTGRGISPTRWPQERTHLHNLAIAFAYFETHPCADCGETDPLVLELDHLRDKEFTVSHGMMDKSWEAILAEIAKCEVVCANCHRRRTLRRSGYRRTRV